jgi:DNA-binding NarL/FixJ family response regulator
MISTKSDIPTEIVVVAPYRMFDETLASLCQEAFASTLTVRFQPDSHALCNGPTSPDLLIVLGAEAMNAGTGTLQRLAEADTKIVALCMNTSAQVIRRYIAMGIRGIVHASRSSQDVIEVLRFVWKGGVFISSEFWTTEEADQSSPPEPARSVDERLPGKIGGEKPAGDKIGSERILARPDSPRKHRLSLQGLTARQRTIMDLVRTGASNKHIARQLAIAESTVKTHLHLIMRIVGVRSRSEIIALASDESD